MVYINCEVVNLFLSILNYLESTAQDKQSSNTMLQHMIALVYIVKPSINVSI